jgi:hypothetical protein
MKTFYYIIVIFSMLISPVFSFDFVPARNTALLVEGTIGRKGLPGFPENRIDGLFGLYEMDTGKKVSVWAVREPLVFDPAIWTAKKAGSYSAFFCKTSRNTQVWIIPRILPMQTELAEYSRWSFVLEYDTSFSEGECVAFAGVFIARTEFFFSSARRFSDLSFPATLSFSVTSANQP